MNKNKKELIGAEEIIKKGRYRVNNGEKYETVYLETSADQVIESESQRFVSDEEKATWSSKADGNHNHDDVYAKKNETYSKEVVDEKLSAKAEKVHGHLATDIGTDETHRFVSDAEKTRWNNTHTREEISSITETINNAIEQNEEANTAEHSSIRKDFASADTALDEKITGVKGELDQAVEDLTNLINNGGTANESLAARVDKIEKTDIPAIQTSLSSLEQNITDGLEAVQTQKADKSELTTAVSDLTSKINVKADKKYVDDSLANKADKETTYSKVETDERLAEKANLVHTHSASQITGLGTASSKDVGADAGQIPVLNEHGKLEADILPSIAVNEKFLASTIEEAMGFALEIGDIVILNADSSESLLSTKKESPKENYKLNDEFSSYIASGRLAYICVDDTAMTFEEKFRPLQSSGDSLSRAEIEAMLSKKLNKTEYNSDKNAMEEKINSKANASDVFTKVETNGLLDTKVDKVSGKGLSANDFTNALKDKLEGVEEGANNYVHPTEDGNLHVPATGSSNNGKVLVAGSTPGAMSWTKLSSNHIQTSDEKQFVSAQEKQTWNDKADSNHTHEQYRLISDSLSTDQTKAEINKLKTIISKTEPGSNVQAIGAVWIQEKE